MLEPPISKPKATMAKIPQENSLNIKKTNKQ